MWPIQTFENTASSLCFGKASWKDGIRRVSSGQRRVSCQHSGSPANLCSAKQQSLLSGSVCVAGAPCWLHGLAGTASSTLQALTFPLQTPLGSRPAALCCTCSKSAGLQATPAASSASCSHHDHLLTHTHMLRVWSCNIWLSLGFVMEVADAGGSPHPRGHQVLEEVEGVVLRFCSVI